MPNGKSGSAIQLRNTTQNNQYSRGTVVWADDPFKNEGTNRPWLIVNNAQYPVPDKRLAVPLTTQKHEQSLEISQDGWLVRDLHEKSYVNPWVLRELDTSYFNGKCGMIFPEETDRVVDVTLDYLSADSRTTPRNKTYERGAIVSAWDRFGNTDGLSRWLIISNDTHPFNFKYLAARLTDSQVRSDSQSVMIDTSEFPDISENVVTVSNLTPLNEDDISRQVGWIGGGPVERVVNQLRLTLL